MILACPEIPQSWEKRPVTWSLAAVNLFIFMVFFMGAPESTNSQLLKDESLRAAGELYLQYRETLPAAVKVKQPAWINEISRSEIHSLEMLGSFAVRDGRFLDYAETGEFTGDAVAIAAFKTNVKKFRDMLSVMPLHRFGLNSEREQSFAWITYQFSHAGWMHLLSNMVFLLFLGWAIEGLWGGGALLALYLAGGVAGGFLFLKLSPGGIIPMVGASGSVSAMIAFYAIAETRRHIRYYYLLFPWGNLHGFIYLPTMMIWPLYLVADFAGLFSAPEGFVTGVAYSAHVGGAVLGALVALNFKLFKVKATLLR